MSKIKLVLTTFLLLGIFANVQASELKRLCGIKAPAFNPSPICDEESGIIFFGGPHCDNEVVMSVYFANLAGFDVLPSTTTIYNLPNTMPLIAVQLDIDFDGDYEFTIGPINGFQYSGDKLESTQTPGSFHYFYEHEIDITQYFDDFDPCPDDEEKTVGIRLVERENGVFKLFDPIPYGSTYDIVSCEVFHETCSLCLDGQGNPIAPNCGSSSSQTQYDVAVCVDCTTDCRQENNNHQGMIIDNPNQIEEIKHEPFVSPNPFSDEITVTFQTQKGNTPTEIEIYDWTGALVIKKSYSPEIGQRSITLDMGELSQGIYYLNLITDETRTTSKIIKL